ncbi:MAG: proton-conducting transporter membrane subunit [Elusimicrobiota bacterium]|jgi:hydrogenase-4 component F
MILALLAIPLGGGLVSLWLRHDRVRRALLLACAVLHTLLTALAWRRLPSPILHGWMALDPLGLYFLSITSLLFLAAAVYGVGYLRREHHGQIQDYEEHIFYINAPEAVFTGCLLLFLATMTLVTVSQHVGLLWVAVEATTLSSAPLIYFHRHHRSLEAAWKYLLICSVGIALALLGNFFLAVAASSRTGSVLTLVIPDLIPHASRLQVPWLKAAFLFYLVGYGTKMGLAPLHTWLPDAHSESPSVVSALLSGALLNCAFLGILRAFQVLAAAGEGPFAQSLLINFGLFSMGIAVVFILGQTDYKRLLAYSSVEHMGILALGVGLGGAGVFGAMLHTINHSCAKAMLFLVAGNLLRVYKSKAVQDVRGACRVLPISGALWIAGFLAITGSPPFGLFISEFTILKAALDTGRIAAAATYLLLLALIFIGMATVMLRMAQGEAPAGIEKPRRDIWITVLPPVFLGMGVLALGLYVPPVLSDHLHVIARSLGVP